MHKPLYVEKQLGSLGDRALWETVSAAGEAGAAHQFPTGKRKQGINQDGHQSSSYSSRKAQRAMTQQDTRVRGC